jgi:hypothetical protein
MTDARAGDGRKDEPLLHNKQPLDHAADLRSTVRREKEHTAMTADRTLPASRAGAQERSCAPETPDAARSRGVVLPPDDLTEDERIDRLTRVLRILWSVPLARDQDLEGH